MPHKVFIRHTYIYKCSNTECNGEWKINESSDLDRLNCPHCGKNDIVEYTLKDQREKWSKKYI
jgi:DNA-directed RNA polymerase subunit RPC12/RpoP